MDQLTASMTNHAMNDATPLRFGIVPPRYVVLRDLQVDQISTNNQKPREIKQGNQHIIANCYALNQEKFLFKGRFVIGGSRSDEAHKKIITVLSVEPDKSERAVSDLVKNLREIGKIDAEFIKDKLFPKYRDGAIKTNVEFYEYLVELGVQERVGDLEKHIKDLEKKSDENKLTLEEYERKNITLRERIIELETQKPNYHGEAIGVSPVCTLKDVKESNRINSRGESVKCTYLEFEEPVPARKMDRVFDKSGAVTEKAKSLIGHKVQTSTWKPEIFKPIAWFRDIYPID